MSVRLILGPNTNRNEDWEIVAPEEYGVCSGLKKGDTSISHSQMMVLVEDLCCE
jgi:hypothetical protein